MQLSIVTGTYNRLESLTRMVDSVRINLRGFRYYEIIIVDGGSTDGTIEWAKSQHDILLIEQGTLLGAVAAFNVGASTASGKYTILANDDIIFMDNAILHAYVYMESNSICGMGCFYQDRNDGTWRINHMRAVTSNGNIVMVPYGQVAIIPTWLGNKLGWWGDYLHTYGGDNHLSCNVWEAGYVVEGIECAYVYDTAIDDALRAINNNVSIATGKHPDTLSWHSKWPNGPHIPRQHINRSDGTEVRILYCPLFERGNVLQQQTKNGLRNALEHVGTVVQYDYMSGNVDDLDIALCVFKPHIVIFQLQDNHSGIDSDVISHFKYMYPDIVFVNWNGDYHPENLYDPQYMHMMKQFHLCGFVTTEILPTYLQADINAWYWQIGYEEPNIVDTSAYPQHDLVYLANGYNAQRIELLRVLLDLRIHGWNIGLYGNWPNNVANGNTLYDFTAGYALYRNAKFALSSQEYPNAVGFVSNRLFQAMSAGNCLVLQQYFSGMTELLGLIPDKHVVVYHDYDELIDKLSWWNAHDDARHAVANAGTHYIRQHYSFSSQVRKLQKRLLHDRIMTWPRT